MSHNEQGPWVRVGDVEVGPHGVREADGTIRPTNSIGEIATSRLIRAQVAERELFERLECEMGD